jgi:hypothetical protein
MRRWASKLAFLGFLLPLSEIAQGLPIGFGYNQGPLSFAEATSPYFKVYFDSRVPEEGLMMLHALDAARPHVEKWFGAHRTRPLPVIMSAVSDNASFANFITDALEVQTMGQGTRSLVWHEYVHQAMYRTVDNLLGPAGNILSLPWMPAWYIEGLADTLAVSVGSDSVAGIERYQALTGDWPSYARLHSLYTKSGFAFRGYATSAGFVRYILKKMGPNRLAEFHAAFKAASMPWWWPYSIVPFADSLPMDRVLKQFTGANGQDLYEEYKKAALEYWSKAPGTAPWILDKQPKIEVSYVGGLKSYGSELRGLVRRGNEVEEVAIEFDPDSGWARGEKTTSKLGVSSAGSSYARATDQNILVEHEDDDLSGRLAHRSTILSMHPSKTAKLKRNGFVYGLTLGKDQLYWLEQNLSVTKLCRIARRTLMSEPAKSLSKKVTCPLTASVPKTLQLLGAKYSQFKQASAQKKNEPDFASELWIRVSEEHLTGTLSGIKVVDLETGNLRDVGPVSAMQPQSVALLGDELWGLFAGRNNRILRHLDSKGTCLEEITLKDHILEIQGAGADAIALKIYAGYESYWRKFPIKNFAKTKCSKDLGPISPIEAALARGKTETLETDLKDADLWVVSENNPASDTAQLEKTPPLDQMIDEAKPSKVRPAKWRGRPVFLFPWIGAEDAFGPQVGIVSIPLMDHLQNETVRATLLYGLLSRFPYQDITLISTRFIPTLTMGIYRQQTYNGRFIYQYEDQRRVVSSFLEEAGGQVGASWNFLSSLGYVFTDAGLKVAYLKPYIGPSKNGRGYLVEPSANVSLSQRLTENVVISESLSGRVAPPAPNHNFDYNQISAGTSLGIRMPLASTLSLGLEGSRMRGKKMRDLREFYLPLKTFIPGSGGGYNRNSFPLLTGGTGGLFSPRFGDTQARTRASWTVPLVREVEKIFWIIYGERLDFTAFYNYGGAWNGGDTGVPSKGWSRLVGAHGYNIDLQMENKGVRFNAGVGTGQVVGKPWEIYLTSGFDAVF